MRNSSATLALVLLAAACSRTAAPMPSPAPPPPPPAPAPAPPPLERITVCVVRNGTLVDVPVSVDPATGDSLYEGRRFGDAFPADSAFAVSAAWYHDSEPIIAFNRRYVKYALPRTLRPGDLVAQGEYRGVTVFTETQSSSRPPELVYLPVRPTCEFQPYYTEMGGPSAAGRARRGKGRRARPLLPRHAWR